MGSPDDEITVLTPIHEKSSAQVVHTEEVQESDTESSLTSDRVEPTDEELATLRRVSETIPLRAW
jgi:hypothetical protein